MYHLDSKRCYSYEQPTEGFGTCSVKGCIHGRCISWPLLPGGPGLCTCHYHDPPPEWEDQVRVSNEPSDAEWDALLSMDYGLRDDVVPETHDMFGSYRTAGGEGD
ncbi:hypothetical protein LCGC14_2528940 [marine sediment metagenome]|uniref:Uncharacterized protein n=1 Tax=marine sediment metagenome TaxID=412755 RepID=A0A0F9AUI6_9ZZZZ